VLENENSSKMFKINQQQKNTPTIFYIAIEEDKGKILENDIS
jgi:hypothetical protein